MLTDPVSAVLTACAQICGIYAGIPFIEETDYE